MQCRLEIRRRDQPRHGIHGKKKVCSVCSFLAESEASVGSADSVAQSLLRSPNSNREVTSPPESASNTLRVPHLNHPQAGSHSCNRRSPDKHPRSRHLTTPRRVVLRRRPHTFPSVCLSVWSRIPELRVLLGKASPIESRRGPRQLARRLLVTDGDPLRDGVFNKNNHSQPKLSRQSFHVRRWKDPRARA